MKKCHAVCRKWRKAWAISRRPKSLPQDRRQISAAGPQSLVEKAGSDQNLRRRPEEGDIGTIAQIERADLGSSHRREPWLLERRIRSPEVSGTLPGNRRQNCACEANRISHYPPYPGKGNRGTPSANPDGREPPPWLLQFVSPAGSLAGTMRSTCGEAQGTRFGAQNRA